MSGRLEFLTLSPVVAGLLLLCGCPRSAEIDPAVPVLPAALRLHAAGADDPDDHCIWYCEEDPSRSLVITSDKAANRLFSFTLTGDLVQTVEISRPGNIDLRRKVRTEAGEFRDVVVVNQRAPQSVLRVYVVDPDSRQLQQVDEGIGTGPNYGGCLWHDSQGGKLFFVTTAKEGQVGQYELTLGGDGKVRGKQVREWPVKYCEGAVANDDAGAVFIAEEKGTLWKCSADPESPLEKTALCRVGELGLKGDLEGLALLPHPDFEEPLLVLSDQGRNRFVVLTTALPVRKLLEFSVKGATQTDGIEILRRPLGPQFPEGIFVCHTDAGDRSPLVVDLREILSHLR